MNKKEKISFICKYCNRKWKILPSQKNKKYCCWECYIINHIPWNKNIPRTKEVKEKLRKVNTGKKKSKETKKKIGNYSRGKTYEELYGEKRAKKLKKDKRLIGLKNKGKIRDLETKKKQRISRIKYIKNKIGYIYPSLGKNEKRILDEIEMKLNYKIIRQKPVIGYFVDGYIPKLNLVIEIDEKGHNYKTKKDKERENNIINKLNCNIIRVKDY